MTLLDVVLVLVLALLVASAVVTWIWDRGDDDPGDD